MFSNKWLHASYSVKSMRLLGAEHIDNEPENIVAAVDEMIDGQRPTGTLHKRFLSLLDSPQRDGMSTLSPAFLRKHAHLLPI